MKFKQWKAPMELSIGKKIKCLKIDNGLEFYNELFNEYYRDQCMRKREKYLIHFSRMAWQRG